MRIYINIYIYIHTYTYTYTYAHIHLGHNHTHRHTCVQRCTHAYDRASLPVIPAWLAMSCDITCRDMISHVAVGTSE